MTIYRAEVVWLNESDACSLEHLVESSGLSHAELLYLVESGVIVPSNDDPAHQIFQAHHIAIARTARRLRDDFELDTQGLALALNLLGRIHELEAELKSHEKLP